MTATIDLKKATAIEDDQPKEKALSPGARSRYADEYDGMYGVERSFRLIFPDDEIAFFADTDEEKARWYELLFRHLWRPAYVLLGWMYSAPLLVTYRLTLFGLSCSGSVRKN